MRELANVGAGHAATALARLLGRAVRLGVPSVEWVSPAAAPTEDANPQATFSAWLKVTGSLTFELSMVMPETDAQKMCQLLLPGVPPDAKEADSALSEAANILASACVNAMSALTHCRLLPSVPALHRERGRAALRAKRAKQLSPGRPLLFLEVPFAVDAAAVSGQLWLVPHESSLNPLFQKLGV
jgi:chemotaxis protein CheC